MRFALLAACLTVYAVNALAADLTFPPRSGRVVDAAGVLTPEQRGKLVAKLKAYEGTTSDQVVIATVPNLQGVAIEDYANQLARAWKIGQAKTNNGVLLLVAPRERKIRLEVGSGLEGALTDALSKVNVTGLITPYLKTGDYYGGLDAGVDGLLSILSRDAEEWQRKPQAHGGTFDIDLVQIAIVIALVAGILIVLIILYRIGFPALWFLPSFSSGGDSSSSEPSSSDDFEGGGGWFSGGGATDEW
ncbi:TPM domain-containing protein [Methylobacterium sp. C33D]